MYPGPWIYSSNRFFPRRTNSQENLDRFILNRSAMDLGYSHYMLTEGNKKSKGKEKENVVPVVTSPSREAYRKGLAEALGMNRTRILAFKNKPPPSPVELIPKAILSPPPSNPRRYISQDKMLSAADILDDFCLNLLDWGSRDVLSIALGNTVYLLNASDNSDEELVTVDTEDGPVTSVGWAPDGRHLAVGLDNSHVQLWDSEASTLLKNTER